jgi:hypothetical protein
MDWSWLLLFLVTLVLIGVYLFRCFGIDTPDSIRGIGLTNAELMRLTSYGGGVGISLVKN